MVSPQVPANDNYGIDQYTKLLVRAGDATASNIKDYSGFANPLVTMGAITGSTTQRKLNPYSLYYSADGCGLSRTNTGLVSRTLNFWMECWVYPTTTTSGFVLWSQGSSTGDYVMWYFNANSVKMYFTAYTGGLRGNFNATMNISANQWYHLAIGRSGTSCVMFKNGVPYTVTDEGSWGDINPSSAATYVGEDSGYGGGYTTLLGYLDEFKYDIGVCRYTTIFAPPTRPYVHRGW
jgi:hypothetical protein